MDVYHYSIIRFVPDAVRDERWNIGVVLIGQEPAYFNSRVLGRSGLRHMLRAADIEGFGFIEDLAQSLELSEVGRQLTWLGKPDRPWNVESVESAAQNWAGVIQFAPLRPAGGVDPDSLLDRLFARHVARSGKKSQDFRTKAWVKSTISREVNRRLPASTNKDRIEKVFRRDHPVQGFAEQHRFDFATQNGHVASLVAAFSIERPDKDELKKEMDAAAWSITDVRRAEPAIKFYAVLLGDERGRPTLPRAQRVFEAAGAIPVTAGSLADLAATLSSEVLRFSDVHYPLNA